MLSLHAGVTACCTPWQPQAVWTAIYTSAEIQGYFADNWAAVAGALKDSPGLLGYEILNEPFAGYF